jgi:hypothetical protein
MSPSSDTKEEEQLGKRAELFWTLSIQAPVGVKLYFSWRSLTGRLFKSHIPSSARGNTPKENTNPIIINITIMLVLAFIKPHFQSAFFGF